MIDINKLSPQKIDCLAFGAHPDDVEASCGGLLIKLNKLGFKTGTIDLTDGGLGTNGTVEIRAEEAKKGSEIMGDQFRLNVGIPEAEIVDDIETRKLIVHLIRLFQPDMLLLPHLLDRHPDHIDTSRVVTSSVFFSGLGKFLPEVEKYRPKWVMSYALHQEFDPSFIVDISNEYEQKVKALLAHESQFKGENKSYISTGTFLDYWEARAKRFGYMIGTKYGEPYKVNGTVGINNPFDLLIKDY